MSDEAKMLSSASEPSEFTSSTRAKPDGRGWLRTTIVLTALSGCFVAARMPLLMSAPLAIYDDEELYNGTAAKELLRGLNLSVRDYMYFPHEGGALVMSVLTVPFFRVFGTDFVALKLSALSVSLATFLIWYCFTLRFLSRTAANYIALLFIAAPPLLLKSDLMTWGHHNNIGLPIALAAYLLLAELETHTTVSRRWRVGGLGFVCGFGMFFAYLFLPMLLTCLTMLLWQRRGSRGGLRTFLLFFAVGISPWFAFNLSNDFAGLNVIGSHAGGSFEISSLPAKGIELFTLCFPLSPGFEDVSPLPRYLLSRIYGVTLLACFFAGVTLLRTAGTPLTGANDEGQTTRRTVVRTASIFCGLYVVVYMVSPFRIDLQWPASDRFFDFRYLLPLYPFLFLMTAVVLEGAHRSPLRPFWTRWWRRGAVAVLGGLGLWGVIHTTQMTEQRPSRSFRGYSYERFGWRCFSRYADNPRRGVEVAERIDPAHVDDFYRGVGWGIAGVWPREDAFNLWYAALPEQYRSYAWEGLAWRAVDNSEGDMSQMLRMGESVEKGYRAAYFRGVGWIVGKRYHGDLRQAIPYLESIPAGYRDAAYFGLGRVLGERTAFTGSPITNLTLVPEEYRTSLQSGLREAETRYEQGRFMDGLTYLRWGNISFYTWEKPF